ncbi:hypothetical protein [Streptomyces sindenensis]|uniref:Uncharacterized protein n=1 Tax=Streptomyces sindenensis TaxID=67363 RepID=A0ABW6ER81_9ACTN
MADQHDDRTPQEWRDVLAGFDYPDDVRKTKGWRARRRAKAEHRDAARRQTAEWVREQRRRDPIRPAGAAIILVLILALGAGARWVWPGLLGESHDQGSRVTATAPPAQDDKPGDAAPPSSSSPEPSTASPTAPAVDLSDPETVAEEAVRLYLTRNPPEDGEHTAAVLRAAPYMTRALAENLSAHSDPAWNRLVSRGGIATVDTVKVQPAGNDLPADSPIRVWRKVTPTVSVEGYTDYKETPVLQLELMLSGSEWRVSRILGL